VSLAAGLSTLAQAAVPVPYPARTPEAVAAQREKQKRMAGALLQVIMERWSYAFPGDYRTIKPLLPGVYRMLAQHLSEQLPVILRLALVPAP
jgi:hypothetical protein